MLLDSKTSIRLIFVLLLLISGFVLMSGPDSRSASEFDPAVFSFRRITLAPILILASYAGIIWLLMQKKNNTCSDEK